MVQQSGKERKSRQRQLRLLVGDDSTKDGHRSEELPLFAATSKSCASMFRFHAVLVFAATSAGLHSKRFWIQTNDINEQAQTCQRRKAEAGEEKSFQLRTMRTRIKIRLLKKRTATPRRKSRHGSQTRRMLHRFLLATVIHRPWTPDQEGTQSRMVANLRELSMRMATQTVFQMLPRCLFIARHSPPSSQNQIWFGMPQQLFAGATLL